MNIAVLCDRVHKVEWRISYMKFDVRRATNEHRTKAEAVVTRNGSSKKTEVCVLAIAQARPEIIECSEEFRVFWGRYLKKMELDGIRPTKRHRNRASSRGYTVPRPGPKPKF